jgi:hypothetical protein
MILLCGIPSESPLALVREELTRLGSPYALFNQRRWEQSEMAFELGGDADVTGFLRIGTARWALEDVTGVYTRLMNEQLLPELEGEPDGSPRRRRCRALHETLAEWYEIAPARVVNRARPQGSNFSKPYQAQLIRAAGFAVPETLVTNDPDLVREFQARHGRLVFKSTSGLRSIVRELAPGDAERLEQIRWCPVQFQAFVDGTNVRVHTVGSDDVFATAVESDATDYRYALRDGGEARLTPVDLPDELAERCLRLAAALGLPFSGIDLKLTPSGEAFCFEVNPSPAFSYYESNTGQPIARALARYLVG